LNKGGAAPYDRAAKEINEADLEELLTCSRDHELYLADVLGDLLKERRKAVKDNGR